MRLDRMHRAATDMEKELCHLVLFLLPNLNRKAATEISTEAAQIIEIQIRKKMLESLGLETYNFATSGLEDLDKRGR